MGATATQASGPPETLGAVDEDPAPVKPVDFVEPRVEWSGEPARRPGARGTTVRLSAHRRREWGPMSAGFGIVAEADADLTEHSLPDHVELG